MTVDVFGVSASLVPDWVPEVRPVMVRAGVFWDAVRVELDLGLRVLEGMAAEAEGQPVGPVIVSRADRAVVFLVPVGSAEGWPVVAGVRVRGSGRWWVAVPPAHFTDVGGGVRWARVPRGTGLVDAELLERELRAVEGEG